VKTRRSGEYLYLKGKKRQEAGESCTMRSSITCTYSSPNITRITKSWKMAWKGHVASTKDVKNAYRLFVSRT
jgi:hypothetical protein